MPRYMALIYGDEARMGTPPPPDGAPMMQEYVDYGEALQSSGVFLAGDALLPTSTATTVRVRDGAVATTDGPFAETKEQLGGFYLFSCKDLDEAIEWAAKIPGARSGSVEVRPIREFPAG